MLDVFVSVSSIPVVTIVPERFVPFNVQVRVACGRARKLLQIKFVLWSWKTLAFFPLDGKVCPSTEIARLLGGTIIVR